VTPPAVAELQAQLERIGKDLKGAVDASIALRRAGQKEEVIRLWQNFLGDFLSYIVARGRATGENLLSGLTLPPLHR